MVARAVDVRGDVQGRDRVEREALGHAQQVDAARRVSVVDLRREDGEQIGRRGPVEAARDELRVGYGGRREVAVLDGLVRARREVEVADLQDAGGRRLRGQDELLRRGDGALREGARDELHRRPEGLVDRLLDRDERLLRQEEGRGVHRVDGDVRVAVVVDVQNGDVGHAVAVEVTDSDPPRAHLEGQVRLDAGAGAELETGRRVAHVHGVPDARAAVPRELRRPVGIDEDHVVVPVLVEVAHRIQRRRGGVVWVRRLCLPDAGVLPVLALFEDDGRLAVALVVHGIRRRLDDRVRRVFEEAARHGRTVGDERVGADRAQRRLAERPLGVLHRDGADPAVLQVDGVHGPVLVAHGHDEVVVAEEARRAEGVRHVRVRVLGVHAAAGVARIAHRGRRGAGLGREEGRRADGHRERRERGEELRVAAATTSDGGNFGVARGVHGEIPLSGLR